MARSVPQNRWLEELAREAHYHAGELAQLVECSGRQLNRLLQGRFRCSPEIWLNDLRLKDVEGLLLSGEPVKQVASMAGFNQTASFCRWFKAQKHMTASRFLAPPSRGISETKARETMRASES